jgi:hypothetical protein
VTHQEAREGWQAVNRGKAEIAGKLHRGDRIREQTVEPVGNGGE